MKDFFTEGTQTASGKILPFSLWLTVGQGEKAKKIGISHLAEDATNFADFIYELEEFRAIYIDLKIDSEEKLYLSWDVFQNDAYDTERVYLLTQEMNHICIYEQNHSEEGYPWSCGLYMLRVTYQNRFYWAAFQVVPKNLTMRQLFYMHELIQGEIADLSYIQFFREDMEEKREKQSVYEAYRNLCIRISLQANRLYLKTVHPYVFLEQKELERLVYIFLQADQYLFAVNQQNWQEIQTDLRRKMLQLQHQFFFINQMEPRTLTKTEMNKAYLPLFSECYPSYKKKIFKPTYLLYEYYCYFFLIQILVELGYQPDSTYEKENRHLFAEALQNEVANLGFEKKQIRIELIYNAVIPTFTQEDFPKTEGLFSLIEKRKPDIRLDLFFLEGKRKKFFSTLMIEVKYSPIYNIYQKKSKTKVMEQLKKYRSIIYVSCNDKGRATYHRNPVYEVLCFYPGNKKLPIVLDTPVALYIQNYPKEDGAKIEWVGKKQVRNLIQTWVHQSIQVYSISSNNLL